MSDGMKSKLQQNRKLAEQNARQCFNWYREPYRRYIVANANTLYRVVTGVCVREELALFSF